MHIAIPFDVETVKQSWGQTSRMWGRVMGNHTFLRALAESPACARITLLVPARKDVDLLDKTLIADFGVHHAKVAIVPFAGIERQLKTVPIDVMHMLDPNMWLAAHIRSEILRSNFPITGVTHSLGNQHFLEWALLNNANGVRAEDCLVCSTPTAQTVIRSIFSRLSGNQPAFNVPATAMIPFGVATERFAGDAAVSRAYLAFDPGTFVVLSLARFNPQFKMDMRPVLRLAELTARKTRRAVKFILAGSSGDGDYVRFVRDHAREIGVAGIVEFALDPHEERKVHLLRAADVFLSLSDNIQETFGLTPIEAMAAGVPVIASDWDGYRSLIEDGSSGFLVPTRGLAPDPLWEAMLALRYDSLAHLFTAQTTAVDLDVASDRLAELAADAALRERMAEAARIRSRQFDWPGVIAQYVELWQRMLASQRESNVDVDGAGSTRTSALRFAGDFACYATATLSSGDRFRVTAAGKALSKNRSLPLLYFETDEFLSMEIMAAVLDRCTDVRSVGQLGEMVKSRAPGGMVQISQNILWLYKYGYLRAV